MSNYWGFFIFSKTIMDQLVFIRYTQVIFQIIYFIWKRTSNFYHEFRISLYHYDGRWKEYVHSLQSFISKNGSMLRKQKLENELVYGKRCQKSKVETFLEIKIKLTYGNSSVLKILDLENNLWNRVTEHGLSGKNNVTDVTRYAGQGFCHFPWINLIQMLICSVY